VHDAVHIRYPKFISQKGKIEPNFYTSQRICIRFAPSLLLLPGRIMKVMSLNIEKVLIESTGLEIAKGGDGGT
jgi:hypothetical protein